MDTSRFRWTLHAGLPKLDASVSSDPGADDPYRPARIVRAWREPARRTPLAEPGARDVELRLDLPRPDNPAWWHVMAPPDFVLAWVGVVASTLYGILEHEPLDLDDGFTLYLVRLLPSALYGGPVDEVEDEHGKVQLQVSGHPGPALVVPVHADELRHVEYELSQVAGPTCPALTDADLRRLNFRSDSVPDQGSDEYYRACLAERSIHMGWQVLRVGPGSVLDRKDVTRAAVRGVDRPAPDRVTLILAPPSAPAYASLFEVRAHVEFAGDHYLVVGEPGGPDGRHQEGGLIVRVEPGEVVLLERALLERVARRLVDSLENGRRGRLFRPMRLEPDADLERTLHVLSHDRDGRPVERPPGTALGLCPHCRAVLELESSYCGYCGAPRA